MQEKYIQIEPKWGNIKTQPSQQAGYLTSQEADFPGILKQLTDQRQKINGILTKSRNFQATRAKIAGENDSPGTFMYSSALGQRANARQNDLSEHLAEEIRGYESGASQSIDELKRKIGQMKRRSIGRYNYDGGGNGGNTSEYDDSRIPFLRERVAVTKGQHTQQHARSMSLTHEELNQSIDAQLERLSVEHRNLKEKMYSPGIPVQHGRSISQQQQQYTQVPSNDYYDKGNLRDGDIQNNLNILKLPNITLPLRQNQRTQQGFELDGRKDAFQSQQSPFSARRRTIRQNDLNDQSYFSDSKVGYENQVKEDINEQKLFADRQSQLGFHRKDKRMINYQKARSSTRMNDTKSNQIKRIYLANPFEHRVYQQMPKKNINKIQTRLAILDQDLFQSDFQRQQNLNESQSEKEYELLDENNQFSYFKPAENDNLNQSQFRSQSRTMQIDGLGFKDYTQEFNELIQLQSAETLGILEQVSLGARYQNRSALSEILVEFKHNFSMHAEKQDKQILELKLRHGHFKTFELPAEYSLQQPSEI